MLRAKYSHQRATEMYTQGQPPADVAQMLVEEGATPDEAPGLARQYYRNFLLFSLENERKTSQNAETHKLIGGVLLAGGLGLSFLMYLMMGNGNYVLFYGAMLAGLFYLLKGFTGKSQAEANINALTEKHRLATQEAAVAQP